MRALWCACICLQCKQKTNHFRNRGLVKSNGTRTILFLPRILPWWPRFQPDSSVANLVPLVYLIYFRQSLCLSLLSRPALSLLWRLASSVSIPSLFAWQMEPKLLWRSQQLAWWWAVRQVARNLEMYNWRLTSIQSFDTKKHQSQNSLEYFLKTHRRGICDDTFHFRLVTVILLSNQFLIKASQNFVWFIIRKPRFVFRNITMRILNDIVAKMSPSIRLSTKNPFLRVTEDVDY